MAADLRLIADAAERNSDELSAERPRDGFSERGFPNARRADKAQDRPLHLLLHLTDGEIFEDAFLDLLQVIVIFVEDFGGRFDVEVVFGLFTPRQFHHPLQVGPDRGGFSRVGMHLFEPLKLLLRLLQHLLGHLGFLDGLAELRDLFGPFVQFAEFLLDRLELLAQEVLALRLVHFALGFRLNLLLHGQYFNFPGDQFTDPAKASDGIFHLQNLLSGLHLEAEVRDGHVGQPAGFLKTFDDHHHVRHQNLSETHEPLELLLDGPQQGFALKRCGLGFCFGDGFDADFKMRFGLNERLDPGFRQTLDENLDTVIRKFQHSHHHADGADGMDVLRCGVLDFERPLGGEHDDPIAGQSGFDGFDRHVSPHEERQDHIGEHDDVPDGQQGEAIRNFDRRSFCRRLFSHDHSFVTATAS